MSIYHCIPLPSAIIHKNTIFKDNMVFSKQNGNLFKMNNVVVQAKINRFLQQIFISKSYIFPACFFTTQQFVDSMQGSPHLSKEEAEKGCKSTHHKENEMEIAYYQEGLFFDQEPALINGDALKDILHRSVGALTFLNKQNRLGVGSGVLISRNIVLTAAHNIFNRETNSENREFKFYLGADGEAKQYCQVEAWRYPQEFKAHSLTSNLTFDYAILKLKQPVEFDGYVKLSLTCPECLLENNKKIKLEVYGFPCAQLPGHSESDCAFKDNFKHLGPQKIKLNQYGLAHKGRLTVFKPQQSKIGYKISTLPGQSGCPVAVDKDIIAIHVGGYKSQFNVGRTVDDSLVDTLWKWRQQLNAAPFQIKDKEVCLHVEKMLEKMIYKLHQDWKVVKKVDLWKYKNLMDLSLIDNKLRQIDLSHNPRLLKLELGNNLLSRIDLTHNKHLTQLKMFNNKLQKIDLRANLYLTQLDLSKNMLEKIDVRANVCLTHLTLFQNQLQEIDVSTNVNLTVLYLRNNQLRDIDVRANLKLTWLSVAYNKITEIDTTNNFKLIQLWAQENTLKFARLRIVEDEKQTNCLYFDDQLSSTCRVQLVCEGQRQAIKEKAVRTAEVLMKRHSEQEYNRNNCDYSFLVV